MVVDDGSVDSTWERLQSWSEKVACLRPVKNIENSGFGNAVIKGIDSAAGDRVVIMMADESDSCEDVLTYWQKLNEGWDCVLGAGLFRAGEQ